MIERKCLKCQTWNGEEKFCKNCGAALAPEEIIREEELRKQEELAKQPKDRFDVLMDRMKHSRFIPVRVIYYIFYSISIVIFAIGSFLAWVVAMTQG